MQSKIPKQNIKNVDAAAVNKRFKANNEMKIKRRFNLSVQNRAPGTEKKNNKSVFNAGILLGILSKTIARVIMLYGFLNSEFFFCVA